MLPKLACSLDKPVFVVLPFWLGMASIDMCFMNLFYRLSWHRASR